MLSQLDITVVIYSQDKYHGFVCIATLTMDQGNDTPLSHKQQLCEIISNQTWQYNIMAGIRIMDTRAVASLSLIYDLVQCKIEKVTRSIKSERSRKDTTSSEQLVSTI